MIHTDNGAEAEKCRILEHEKSLWKAWKHWAFRNEFALLLASGKWGSSVLKKDIPLRGRYKFS